MDIKLGFWMYIWRKKILEQQERFTIVGQKNKVYQLKKSLYNLKQSPRIWYSKIKAYFENLGFERSLSESTLYSKGTNGKIHVVSLYVDDLLITENNKELIDKSK